MNSNQILGIVFLIGATVGLGVFGLPYVVSQVGFWPGIFYLLILGGIILFINLMYSEINLRTLEADRLPGFAAKYLGEKAKKVVAFSTFVGVSVTLVVYILAGGKFLSTFFEETALHNIFSAGFLSPSLVLWFLLSLGIVFGIRSVSKFEFFMFILFIVTLLTIFFVSFPHVNTENLSGFNPQHLFLPYGVILFSLTGGIQAIPVMREMFRNKEKKLKKGIIAGTLIPIILYALFTFIVVGVSGDQTSSEAIQGLISKVDSPLLLIGALFGIMTVSTSFLIIGLYLRDTLIYDFNIKKMLSTLFVVVVPLLGLLLQQGDLIPMMAFVGTVLGAFENVVLIFIFKNSKMKEKADREPEYKIKIAEPFLYLLSFIFIAGLIYEIIRFF